MTERNTFKSTKETQDLAKQSESLLAEILGGIVTPQSHPFDVIIYDDTGIPKILIEVKTVTQSNHYEKITMRKECLKRKRSFARKFKGIKVLTVVFDCRNGNHYHKKGIGNFRLSNMKEGLPK